MSLESDETTGVQENAQAEQTEASPSQSSNKVDTTGLQEQLAQDLLSTVSKPEKGVPEKESSEAGTQEESVETTEAEESDEQSPTAESESQESQAEEVEQTEQDVKNPKLVKHLRTVIKDTKAEANKARAEAEALRAEVLARANQPMLPPKRPDELTPEYWSKQYWQLKREGVTDDDPRQIEAIQKHDRFKDEVLVERISSQQAQQAIQQRATKAFVDSMFEVHTDNPFLVRANNPLGFDIDPQSAIGQKIVELATSEGVSLANNPAFILSYAQRADRILLRQQLGLEHQTVDTAKRKLAEGLAKGTITQGNRRAPAKAPSPEKRLDDLTVRASGGGRSDREALAAASLAKDLGL